MTDKKYETEFSFSFENLGNTINKALGSLTNEEVTYTNFTEAIGNAQSARIKVEGSIGRISMKAADDPNTLFHAETAHLGKLDFQVSGDTEKTVHLQAKEDKEVIAPVRRALSSIGKRADLYWNMWLARSIPIRLDIEGGVGPAEYDLTGLNLVSVELDGGVGPNTLTLPTAPNAYTVKLDSGIGGLILHAPATTRVNLIIEGGVGSTVIHVPENANLNIRIDGGVGSTTIHTAAGVALHVEAESGVGGLSIPHTLKQLNAKDDFMSRSGIWETPGFALSGSQVTISYEGGVGSFKIVQPETPIV